MTTLLYALCFGTKTFSEMTRLCLGSMRGRGHYRGDIVVFTDGSFRTTDSTIRIVNVGAIQDPIDIKSFKSAAARYIDPSRYSHIAMTDVDVLALSDINPLFDGNAFAVRGMREVPFNTMLAEPCGGTLLSPGEREDASRSWGINTGFLCMASEVYGRMMDEWAASIRKRRQLANYFADQPYFNHLVLQGKIEFDSYPDHWIEMPAMYHWFRGTFRLRPEVKLLHFCGDDKEHCLRQMRTTEHALSAGRSPKELESAIWEAVVAPRSRLSASRLGNRAAEAIKSVVSPMRLDQALRVLGRSKRR